MLVWAFLFGAIALVLAAWCGAAIKDSKHGKASVLGLISLVFMGFFALAIDSYHNPYFNIDSRGVVLASSFAETPKVLRERGIQNYVFIVEGENKKQYKITSNDLVYKNEVLKPGDRVTRYKDGVRKVGTVIQPTFP